jgi:xylulokinase
VTFVLGVDVGSQSVKGVLLDGEGTLRASASYPLAMKHPHGGWAEQDPRHWEDGLASVIAATLSSAGIAASEVTALCLACQVDGVVPIAASGEAIGPAIIWLDRRAERQVNDLAEAFGVDRLFELTGLVPDSSHSGPKIMWLRDHQPAVFADAAAFPPAAGYLVMRLTGRLALDHANASSSLLYDLRARQWSDGLLESAGLRAEQLGEILNADDIAGPLSAQGVEITGLSRECLVLVGTGDEHAASVGAGALAPGCVTDVTGTAEPVTVASDHVVLDHEGLVETHAHALRDRYLVENPGFVSGGSTLWLAKNVLKVTQVEFFELASSASPGADEVLFLPALSGAMTPKWNARMRGTFAGLAMHHTAASMARAVLEGCAFALRDVTDRFTKLGLGEGEIRVVGGGAASETWMQIKADVTGREVRRVLVSEATALGAALLAGVATGVFQDMPDAVSRSIQVADEPFRPDPTRRTLYDENYDRYRRLYDGVEGALT